MTGRSLVVGLLLGALAVTLLLGCGAGRRGLSSVSYGELLAVLVASQSIGGQSGGVPPSVLCLPLDHGMVQCSSFP